ncbi:MAG: hypothetical protein ACC618_04715 [Patescibacteria group bacterium]
MSEDKETVSFNQRKEYFTRKISEYLAAYPINFKEFVGDEEIIKFGDELLSHRLTAGYNFATLEQFPISSKDSLIFYGVYAQRTEHFGELLARMEDEGIISEESVGFGVRATKIFGKWDDPETVPGKITMKDNDSKENARESVEAVVIFRPNSADRAEDIATFLLNKAPKIEGGYEVPDIRATATDELIKALAAEDAFKIAKANIYRFDTGNVISLRQETATEKEGWNTVNSLLNPELYEYLTISGVAP